MTGQIILNAFDMACVGHIQHGMWTHPRDHSSDYTSLDYWVSLAKLLERGLFDGLFLADILGVYDVMERSPAPALRASVQIPLIDPMALIPAMAHATTHLGFGVTGNLVYEPPFLFARRMATLDHLTNGRIGWNIVTGALDSAARAMGLREQLAHDDRYDLADEYMQVVYALWEGGWRDDAVVRDRDRGVYTDPARVRRVRHEGKQYRLDALPLWEPSPQRTPVLYQAGGSSRGRVFAARHAECGFRLWRRYAGNIPPRRGSAAAGGSSADQGTSARHCRDWTNRGRSARQTGGVPAPCERRRRPCPRVILHGSRLRAVRHG